MKINSMDYNVLPDRIVYNPVAGLEIREALQNGLVIFETEKKVVEVNINDIIISINSSTNITKLVTEYFTKLERRVKKAAINNQIDKTL